jgi:vancomycin resistance protein YoaR
MSITTVHRKASSTPAPPVFLRAIVALIGGVSLFILITLGAIIAFDAAHAGEIYPGVSMDGIELSGLTPQAAADKLARNLLFPQTGKIVFEDGQKIWVVSPAALGLGLDYNTNARFAYQVGRSGNLFKRVLDKLAAWRHGVDVSPALVYNEQAALNYLSQIATEIDRPTKEASLRLEGVEVVAVPGQVGRKLDVSASLENLKAQIEALSDGVLPLVIQETPPEIMDASQQAEAARQILSQPLTLVIPNAKEGDPGPWKIPPSQLSQMLKIERQGSTEGAKIQVELSDEAMLTYLNALAGDINRSPQDARFIFNDDTRKLDLIQPAVIGRSLDANATVRAIHQNIAQNQHTVPLVLSSIQPEVSDNATGEQLGVTENIVTYTSYFRGSDNSRLQNIKNAAANFHGLLVPPGATFSMASVMGDVSLDTGYAEAWIIYGGRTIKGVGGGVCQVSTTLFRTAFMAGFPIAERHPHAYRVGYYEQTAGGTDAELAGLDATVFVPMVDFKFVNDSPYWLLMETYFNAASRSLTWKFYSTSDGRRVEWETSGLQNVVDPPDPVYEENQDLAKGEVKQVDWAVEGADVTVTRAVYRNDQVILSDSFSTHYIPWADVYQYGPGTNLNKLIRKKTPPIITR